MSSKAAGGGALNALKEKMQHLRDENEKLKDDLEEKSAQLEYAQRTIDTVGVAFISAFRLLNYILFCFIYDEGIYLRKCSVHVEMFYVGFSDVLLVKYRLLVMTGQAPASD